MPEPYRYPQLDKSLKKGGFLSVFAFFGPGAIIASVTIGSGETVFASRGGAIFGYTLLWCFLGGGLMKFIQVYTAARYITLTGEHPVERWSYLPGPRGWMVWILAISSILCFPLWLSGLPKMLGGLTIWILGLEGAPLWGDARVWGTIFVVVAITLTFIQSYSALEFTQTILVGFFLACILVASVASQPDWAAALAGSIIPILPSYEPWLGAAYPAIASRPVWIEVGTYLGAVGGGTYDYFGYIGMLKEKNWGLLGQKVKSGPKGVPLATDDENMRLGKKWLKAPLSDVSVSFFCVILFTFAFVILGAATLHPAQIVPEGQQLLTVQSGFLTALHPNLLYLYEAGVFLAFFGTILAAYELFSRTAKECLQPLLPAVRRAPLKKVRTWVVTYCGVVGLTIMWMGGNPVQIVTPAALFGGVFTCGLWCLLMVWTDWEFLPRALRMGWGLRILNILSGLFMAGWGARGIYEFLFT